jgi:hypothetical protein
MKLTLILILAASSCAFAQDGGNVMYQGVGPGGAIGWGSFENGPAAPVKGAPYSATINNESIQTLADGNRIVQTNTGTTARDSQGRTRQDAAFADDWQSIRRQCSAPRVHSRSRGGDLLYAKFDR